MLAKDPGVRADKYNALMERAGEIGATDLEMPDPWTTAAPVATTAAPAAVAPTATPAE